MCEGWCLEQGQIIVLIKIYQFPLARHPYLSVAEECVWVTSTAWGAFTVTHLHLKVSVEVFPNLKIKKSIVKVNLQIKQYAATNIHES